MTFVLPLKTESCPVHKDSPGKIPRRTENDEEEFPVLKESPAALKTSVSGSFRGRSFSPNPVPEESFSASETDAGTGSGSGTGTDLRMLSNYVEFLSKGVDLDLETESAIENYRLIPPPVDFCSAGTEEKNNFSDTEMTDFTGTRPCRNLVDIRIRRDGTAVPPQTTVPVLGTFKSGNKK